MDARARECSRPDDQFDGRAVDRDPLRFGARGDQVAIECGPELHAGGHAVCEAPHPVERRRPVARADAGGLGVPSGAAGGVEPDGVDSGEVDVFGACVPNLCALAERGEVVGGEGGGDLVGVDGDDIEADPGEGEGVAADAAAEVGDPADARVAEAARVARGHLEAGRLLEPRAREEHATRERTELGPRAVAQPCLAHRRRNEVGGVPRSAQVRHRRGDLVGALEGAEVVDQTQSLGGEQRGQLGEFHPASLGSLRQAERERPHDRRRLALALHECQRRPRLGVSTPTCRVLISLFSDNARKR